MDDAHGFHCSNMQLEQCQMVVCKFIAAVQYMHVLRQLRRGFRTIVLHSNIAVIFFYIINPWRMREGYGSRSVCLSVRLSVTALAATYRLFMR